MKTEQLLLSALKAQKTIRITKATFHSYFQISSPRARCLKSGESSKQLSKVKASSQFADEERDSNWLG